MDKRNLEYFRNTWLNEGEIERDSADIEKQFPALFVEAKMLKGRLDAIMDAMCDWALVEIRKQIEQKAN